MTATSWLLQSLLLLLSLLPEQVLHAHQGPITITISFTTMKRVAAE